MYLLFLGGFFVVDFFLFCGVWFVEGGSIWLDVVSVLLVGLLVLVGYIVFGFSFIVRD